MRQLSDIVNSVEPKWQLDVANIIMIVIVIVVLLHYAEIDTLIRPSSAPNPQALSVHLYNRFRATKSSQYICPFLNNLINIIKS